MYAINSKFKVVVTVVKLVKYLQSALSYLEIE